MRYQFPCFWPLGLSFVLKGEQRTQLASECFEPCQPQRMISGLKTTFSLISYVIHPTSHSTTSLFFSNPNSNFTYNFGTQTLKNNNTCFGAYLYSMSTQDGNLHQLSVTISRVTCLILQAHTGTGVIYSQQKKNSGELLEKMQVNWQEGWN